MAAITSLPGSNEGNDDCDGAVLVLIGFPGSGKSETGNTIIGQRVFKTELKRSGQNKQQEANSVLGDLNVTVRDMTGFESITEFEEIYNSLTDLECRKVVFGLTIGIGRLPPGYTETLHNLFKADGIGEHLKRKTFIIFTKVDALLKYNEAFYKDKFDEWLKDAKELDELITSLQLHYCFIQNKQSGDKQVQQAAHVGEKLKRILQSGNEQETWYNGNKNIISNYSEFPTSKNDFTTPVTDSNVDHFEEQIMKKECTITWRKVMDWLDKLQEQDKSKDKINTIHEILLECKIETESTRNSKNASRLLDEFEKRNKSKCWLFEKCNIL